MFATLLRDETAKGRFLWWGEAPECLKRFSSARDVDQSIMPKAEQCAEPFPWFAIIERQGHGKEVLSDLGKPR